MAQLKDWNLFEKNVQSGISEGQFISSATIVVGAGPPFLTGGPVFTGPTEASPGSGGSSEGDQIFLIGMIGQWNVQQQMAVIPVPEAGSNRYYNITGPVNGSVSLQKTLVHGPSLLKCIQAHRSITDVRSAGGRINSLINTGAAEMRGYPMTRLADSPGQENAFFNLASQFFTQPSGLLFYMSDIGRETYGAIYCEQFLPQQHAFGSGPGSMVVSEQVSGPVARVRTVQVARPVPLLSRPENAGKMGIAASEFTTGGAASTFLDITTQSNR
jgi:hypothetical protein